MAKLFVLFIIVSAAVVSCRRITKRHAEEPNHFYHQYEKTGEMLKSGSSRVPYSSSFDFNYPNDEFSGAESSNFYDIGGPSGLGFNQFSNIGYSSPNIGFGNGYLGGSGFGGNFASGGNYIRPGFYSGGYVQPFGVGYHGSNAGGYVDANKFESAKKNSGDENLQKVDVKVGGSSNEGSQGYNQGAVESTKAKGDAGYYKNETANKNQVGDEKAYQGSQNFDKSGKQGNVENSANKYKKGHVTKGFKSSHRKDEEEKTETFYDEAHDEADKKKFDHNHGAFGEKSESAFKGGQEKEVLDSKAEGKHGHFNSENSINDAKANKGEFGQTAFKENADQLHRVNGLDAHSILGHQEVSGKYFNNKPQTLIPIHTYKK